MRTWGRVPDANGDLQWVEVSTDPQGYNDEVYITTLCQVFLLNLGESPFYANYGLPAEQSVMQQIYPDFNVILTQQYFKQYFASLTVSRRVTPINSGLLIYDVSVTTQQGVRLNKSVPIPT